MAATSSDEKRVERTFTRLLPPHVTSAAEAYDEWLQYAWIGGADLPLAGKPIILERGTCVFFVWVDSWGLALEKSLNSPLLCFGTIKPEQGTSSRATAC